MMISENVLTKNELVQTQNFMTICFSAVLALMVGGVEVYIHAFQSIFSSSTPWMFLMFLFLSIGVFTIGATLQITAVRRLGSDVYTSFSGWRVICCVSLSFVILKEAINEIIEWVGICIIIIALTIFLTSKKKEEEVQQSR